MGLTLIEITRRVWACFIRAQPPTHYYLIDVVEKSEKLHRPLHLKRTFDSFLEWFFFPSSRVGKTAVEIHTF